MAFTQHNKSVNVDRLVMLTAIRNGLEIHQLAYNEALVDFKEYALSEFTKIQKALASGDFSKTTLMLTSPVSHVAEYNDAIEIFEMSVDQNINVDLDTFKAYFKNEWSWSRSFELGAALYKSAK